MEPKTTKYYSPIVKRTKKLQFIDYVYSNMKFRTFCCCNMSLLVLFLLLLLLLLLILLLLLLQVVLGYNL